MFNLSLHDLNQLHIKDECSKWRNRAASTTLAVCQTIGDEETIFGPLLHQLQAFRPSGNDLLKSEYGRLTTLNTAVKYGTVNEETLVVALYAVLGRRLLAVTFLQHLILQTGG